MSAVNSSPFDDSEFLRQQELAGYRGIYESINDQLDPISKLVRDFCSAPIAGISLVDRDQVLLKSRIGIEADQIPRTGAFCSVAVESNLPFFEVADAQLDERFASNPLVTSEAVGIRSYAAAPLRSPRGYHIGTVWVMDRVPRALDMRSVLLLKAMAKQVMEYLNLSYTDAATRLLNRRGFLDTLEPLLVTWKRESRGAVVLACEIPETHLVRDAHGWDEADRMLSTVAARLGAICSGRDEFCAHLGGGTFAAVLRTPLPTSDDEALRARLAPLTREPFAVGGRLLTLQPRVGVSSFPRHGSSAPALLDKALLAAGSIGPGQDGIHHFEASAAIVRQREVAMIGRVRAAFAAGEFVPWFQPRIDLDHGRIVALQVQARWEHGEEGAQQLSAAELARALRGAGLTAAFELALLKQACAWQRAWRDEGVSVPAIVTRLSPETINLPGFIDTIDDVVAQHDLPAGVLGFEFVEADLMGDYDRSRALLAHLRKRGMVVAIDDFGSGFSNLLALRDLSFNAIKVDLRLLGPLGRDAEFRSLFKLVRGIAAGLECGLVCEGVDEAADLIAVTDLGAGLVQGRFFALPQPGEGITAWSPLLGGELTLPEDRWERARTIAAWLHERSSEV